MKDIIPGRRRRDELERYLISRRKELDRLFADLLDNFGISPFWYRGKYETFSPKIDVKEDDKFVKISAEIPGIEQKDIEITLTDEGLVIKGEKKEEKTMENEKMRHSECRYGCFERVIPITTEVDKENVKATFKNGELKVILEKKEVVKETGKKIEIESE